MRPATSCSDTIWQASSYLKYFRDNIKDYFHLITFALQHPIVDHRSNKSGYWILVPQLMPGLVWTWTPYFTVSSGDCETSMNLEHKSTVLVDQIKWSLAGRRKNGRNFIIAVTTDGITIIKLYTFWCKIYCPSLVCRTMCWMFFLLKRTFSTSTASSTVDILDMTE